MKIKFGDILVTAAAIAVAMLGITMLKPAQSVKIYADGKLFATVQLDENADINVNGTHITVENGSAGFTESDCPDKLCVKAGRMNKCGQTAACVPNRVVIALENGNIDGITG